MKIYWIVLLIFLLTSCYSATDALSTDTAFPLDTQVPTTAVTPTSEISVVVQNVEVSGDEMGYTFSVEVLSPDEGCQRYADWWEVLDEDGSLIYRRILAHSHVNEQPFVRSGGPVPIPADQTVVVRAHMHPDGYGSKAMKGSPQAGFEQATLDNGFANELEQSDPLPSGCDF